MKQYTVRIYEEELIKKIDAFLQDGFGTDAEKLRYLLEVGLKYLDGERANDIGEIRRVVEAAVKSCLAGKEFVKQEEEKEDMRSLLDVMEEM